jgi:hypothetical protein
MPISATATGVVITGPESPISTIVITDPDGNESVLNMGLVNSRGMDNIIAGTSYELELSGFGAFGGYAAFVDPNAATIKPLGKLDFILNNPVVNGYRTTKNTEVLKFTPSGDLTGVVLDTDGFFDFSGNDVTRVTVECLGRVLDSDITDGDSIIIGDSQLDIEFGDFDIPAGLYRTAKLGMYVSGSAEPIIIAGPNLTSEIELHYHN